MALGTGATTMDNRVTDGSSEVTVGAGAGIGVGLDRGVAYKIRVRALYNDGGIDYSGVDNLPWSGPWAGSRTRHRPLALSKRLTTPAAAGEAPRLMPSVAVVTAVSAVSHQTGRQKSVVGLFVGVAQRHQSRWVSSNDLDRSRRYLTLTYRAKLNLRTKVLDFVRRGCPAWIRTRVNRSKVCCATTAPRGNGERNAILAGRAGAGQRRAGPARPR